MAIFLDTLLLTQVVIFVSTAAECNTHTHTHTHTHTLTHTLTHTHAGSPRTLSCCLSFSASLVLTAHLYSDHTFFTMLLPGGFQSSPYATALQSPLLVFDVPSFHFILFLCACVLLSYVCFLFYFCWKQSLRLCKHYCWSAIRAVASASTVIELRGRSDCQSFPSRPCPHFLQSHINT